MAGWSTGVSAGATPPSWVTAVSTPGGRRSASQARNAALTAAGVWSGTRRKATLKPPVAGTIVFMPGPPYPECNPTTSAVGRTPILSRGV